MSVRTMQDLLIDELKDLYSAEKQIVRALPKLAKATATPELQRSILSHLEETKGQVIRLEKIGGLGLPPLFHHNGITRFRGAHMQIRG